MLRTLKIRLYPTGKQKVVLQQHFDGYRFAYNLCLDYKIKMWEWYKINKSGYDLQNELASFWKEVPWLSTLKYECIRQAALDVGETFQKFYKGSGFPKFKSKKDKNSFAANQAIRIKKGKLSFFKNLLKFKTSEEYKNKLLLTKIKKCRFLKDGQGKFWACLLIEDNSTKNIKHDNYDVGIDLGLSNFITTSNNEVIQISKFYQQTEGKLKKLQRKHSKSKKGGKNRGRDHLM